MQCGKRKKKRHLKKVSNLKLMIIQPWNTIFGEKVIFMHVLKHVCGNKLIKRKSVNEWHCIKLLLLMFANSVHSWSAPLFFSFNFLFPSISTHVFPFQTLSCTRRSLLCSQENRPLFRMQEGIIPHLAFKTAHSELVSLYVSLPNVDPRLTSRGANLHRDQPDVRKKPLVARQEKLKQTSAAYR